MMLSEWKVSEWNAFTIPYHAIHDSHTVVFKMFSNKKKSLIVFKLLFITKKFYHYIEWFRNSFDHLSTGIPIK